jgi:RNA-directed DNA polymerase
MSSIEEINLEKMLSRPVMQKAWQAVKTNDGSPGVDRMTIEATERHLKEHWEKIRAKLLEGIYQPAAVKAIEIPKANGGKRKLGIPTVMDRLIQQAMQQVISAALDAQMSPHSYGFRPGRSAHDAVKAAAQYVASGKQWVVDIDLRRFFDEINHDKLMQLLSKQIADKRILKLIGRYLRAPTRDEDGRQRKRTRGTPQGGPLSPLLANLYLGSLDAELSRRGIAFVRYADDIALFVASERSAQRVLARVKAWLQRELDLPVNDDKSGIGRSEESELLGFRILADGTTEVSPTALSRMKDKVRTMWNARVNWRLPKLKEQWRWFICGWWNYFSAATVQYTVRNLSGWIRRHMRKYFWQRWHNRAGRRRALHALGVRGRSLGIAGSRLGAWRLAKHIVIHQALGTARLNRNGWFLPWELAH